jgi:NitT/TauT family transport system permease protein
MAAAQGKRPFDPWTIMLPLGSTIVVLLLVEGLKRAGLLSVIIPAPSDIIAEVVRDPAIVSRNVGPTVATAIQGYLAAAIITLLAGALGVLVRALRNPIYNIGITLYAIPIIATAPLLASWLGTGPSLQITIAALSSQFSMLVSTMEGLDAVDTQQRELFHSLSASRWQSLRLLLLPSALPYLFIGFKIAAPSAVLGAVTAEWAGADHGVGAMMLYALFSYDIAKVWLSVLLTCALAAGAYGFWVVVEKKVIFWMRDAEAL